MIEDLEIIRETQNYVIAVLDDIIRTQISNYPKNPSYGVTKLIDGTKQIFRSIVTIPELDGYAITSTGFVFRNRPLAYAVTNGVHYLTDVYGYDFYDGSGLHNVRTKFGFDYLVDPLQLIIHEFFGYHLDMSIFEKSWIDCTNIDVDDLAPFLTPLESNTGYGTENYFLLFNW